MTLQERSISLKARDLGALMALIAEATGVQPRTTASTPFDGVYETDGRLLAFTGSFRDERGLPEERAVLLQRWDEVLLAGRNELIPVMDYYHDRNALLYRCALSYLLNTPLALHGHTGVGKTDLVRYFAALLGAPVYRMNLHGLSTNDDIIGKLLPAGQGTVAFQDGLVTTGVRRGGILLLEEMNATGQEVWFSLHGLLDGSRALTLVEKDNEVVHQHPACRLYATFNPAEYPNLYPGTKDLSAAYLRRWVSVRIGFASLEVEREIILRRFPAYASPPLSGVLDTMLDVARVARDILTNRIHSFNFVLSTGALEVWAKLTIHLGPVSAAKMTFYDMLDDRMKTIFREQIFAYVTDWDTNLLDSPA